MGQNEAVQALGGASPGPDSGSAIENRQSNSATRTVGMGTGCTKPSQERTNTSRRVMMLLQRDQGFACAWGWVDVYHGLGRGPLCGGRAK